MDYVMQTPPRKPFKSIGKGCLISSDAVIIGAENIEIGDYVRIDAGVTILASKGFLKLGNYIHIAAGVTLLCAGGIEVGDFCNISFGSQIISASDNFDGSCLVGPMVPKKFTDVTEAKITIKKHAQVASMVLILPGATIEEGACVGANSHVRPYQVLNEFSFYFGIPCEYKATRKKECKDMEYQLLKDIKIED